MMEIIEDSKYFKSELIALQKLVVESMRIVNIKN